MKGKFSDINTHEIGGCEHDSVKENRNLEIQFTSNSLPKIEICASAVHWTHSVIGAKIFYFRQSTGISRQFDF